MNIFSSSPNSLRIVQLLSLVILLTSPFVAVFNWQYVLLAIIMFYCYSILGISMMLHRYYTHKSFKLGNLAKWFYTVFAVLAGRGSPLSWVYIHRIHHATSDTEKDPHSPHNKDFSFVKFKPADTKFNPFIVKELLTPVHLKIEKYYLLFILAFLLLLSIINYNLVIYMWAMPVFVVSVSQIMFNYFCHMDGYRNFATDDFSTNNKYMWPFILGDAWHNNHHKNSAAKTTQIKWWELDPVKYIIKVIEK